MNNELLKYVYNIGELNDAIPGVIIFFGTYLPYGLAFGLLVYLIFYRGGSFQRRLFIIASSLLSSIIAYVGILLLRTVYISSDRPFVTLPDVKPLIDTGQAFHSFPSLHAAIFFAAGVFLYFYHRRLGTLYIIAALLMSIARVIAGVHWPLDILAGALVGGSAAWVVRWFTLSIKRNL